jgi:threonine dehydratase
VDDIVAVSDEQILDAVAFLHRSAKLVVEPSGAVGVAALRAGKIAADGRPMVVLLSGGNVDPALLCRLLT